MSYAKKYSEKSKDALRRAASANKEIREDAQQALAQALTVPLRKAIFDRDSLGEIFVKEVLEPGGQANYPLDFIKPGYEDEFVAFTLPKQGRIPERHVEGDELWVQTFRVGNTIDWDISYAENARFNVIERCIRAYEDGYIRKNNSDGWRTILAAADGRGLIVSATGAAPFTGATVVPTAAAGQFTKELVSRMKTAMMRGAGGNGPYAGRLTDLYLSPEAMEDIRAWDADEVDEFTRRQIFVNEEYGLASIYGVTLHEMTEFGIGQEYQNFLTNVTRTSFPGSEVEWCVGLDLSTKDSFLMPIRRELETLDDPTLYRQMRMGIYGWMEHGFAALDPRRVILGCF